MRLTGLRTFGDCGPSSLRNTHADRGGAHTGSTVNHASQGRLATNERLDEALSARRPYKPRMADT